MAHQDPGETRPVPAPPPAGAAGVRAGRLAAPAARLRRAGGAPRVGRAAGLAGVHAPRVSARREAEG